MSVYLVTGFNLGGDIKAFLPRFETAWPSYFEPLSTTNRSFIYSEHFRKIFQESLSKNYR